MADSGHQTVADIYNFPATLTFRESHDHQILIYPIQPKHTKEKQQCHTSASDQHVVQDLLPSGDFFYFHYALSQPEMVGKRISEWPQPWSSHGIEHFYIFLFVKPTMS